MGYWNSLKAQLNEEVEKQRAEGEKLRDLKKQHIPYCPKCHSTSIHAEKRGWKLSTGFLGSSKIIITCLNCGHKWKP